MSAILTDFSPAALAAAIDNGHRECFTYFGRSPRAQVSDTPEWVQLVSGLPHPIFNGIFRPRLALDRLDDQIEAAMTPFRERGLPMFWWVGPESRPRELGPRLEAHGLQRDGGMPGMAVDLRSLNEDIPTASGFTIETVRETPTLREWGQVTNRSFQIPGSMDEAWLDHFTGVGLDLPLRYYLGRWNGKPVATSLLGLFAGAAGIFAVATLPEARRQGFGAAITLAPLREGREMGYRVGILSASPMGFSVYQRLGFREYCKLTLYRWPPDPAP